MLLQLKANCGGTDKVNKTLKKIIASVFHGKSKFMMMIKISVPLLSKESMTPTHKGFVIIDRPDTFS